VIGVCVLNKGQKGFTLVFKPLSHQSGVFTAFKKFAERRVARCAKRKLRCANAVQSHRTPCGGVYFEHAQNKRLGVAFPQRVRQNAVATL